MNKKEFLQELKEHLIGLKEEDVKEILEDYEEHFRIGKRKKRKESEIAKSLGNPKEIAREVRRELHKYKEVSLNSSLIEFWVNTKKLGRNIWKNIKKEVAHAKKKVKEIFEKIEKKEKKKKKIKRKRSGWKITLLILLNLFLILWLWIGLLGGIIGLIVSSWAIIFSGIVSILGVIFGFIVPHSRAVNDLFLSALFGLIGLTSFGFIFSIGTWQLGKAFFWLTNKYLKWNNKIFGGRK
ncbi:DUF1700 domain-containing protein [archaeon]|nr:DUF1700 domain-containing protein [archaeon]